jgi:hypothetical protein
MRRKVEKELEPFDHAHTHEEEMELSYKIIFDKFGVDNEL